VIPAKHTNHTHTHTVLQYSCIGCVSLWPFDVCPEKKHFWHMSKLKHFRQRYLDARANKQALNGVFTRTQSQHYSLLCLWH